MAAHVRLRVLLGIAALLTILATFQDPIIRQVWWLPPSISAITVYPLIVVTERTTREPYFDCTVAHENLHWQEIRREGAVTWYARYWLLRPWYSPLTHPMEIEALAVGDNCVRERG